MTGSIYYHGLPGFPDELDAFSNRKPFNIVALPANDIAAFDRQVSEMGPVILIGFSLGAYSALNIAAQRPDAIKELILISPAAPLELGDFLPKMAGAPIFRLAGSSKLGFAAVTILQSIASRLIPHQVLKGMFKDSCKAEQQLLKDEKMSASLIKGLRQSFGPSRRQYRRVVESYVRPWATTIDDIKCPCRIFHGELDNWSPIGMSEALVTRLPASARLTPLPKLGHYSTLAYVLDNYLRQELEQSCN